jgi:hypothetical protein
MKQLACAVVVVFIAAAGYAQFAVTLQTGQQNQQSKFLYSVSVPQPTTNYKLPPEGQFLTVYVNALYVPQGNHSFITGFKRALHGAKPRLLLVSEFEQDINDPTEKLGPHITKYFPDAKPGQLVVGHFLVDGPTYWHKSDSHLHLYLYAINSTDSFAARKDDAEKALNGAEGVATAFIPFGSAVKELLPKVNDGISKLVAQLQKNDLVIPELNPIFPTRGKEGDLALAGENKTFVFSLETEGPGIQPGDQFDANWHLYSSAGVQKSDIAYLVLTFEKKTLTDGIQTLISNHLDVSNAARLTQIISELNKSLPADLQVTPPTDSEYKQLLSRKVYLSLVTDLKQRLAAGGDPAGQVAILREFLDNVQSFADSAYLGFQFDTKEVDQAFKDIESMVQLDSTDFRASLQPGGLLSYISAVRDRLTDASTYNKDAKVFQVHLLSTDAESKFEKQVSQIDVHDSEFTEKYRQAFIEFAKVVPTLKFPSERQDALRYMEKLTHVPFDDATGYIGWIGDKRVCSTPDRTQTLFGDQRTCIDLLFESTVVAASKMPDDIITAVRIVFESTDKLDPATKSQVLADMYSHFIPVLTPGPASFDKFQLWSLSVDFAPDQKNKKNIRYKDPILDALTKLEQQVQSVDPTVNMFSDIVALSDDRKVFTAPECTAFLQILDENSDFIKWSGFGDFDLVCNNPRIVKNRYRAWVRANPKLDDGQAKLVVPVAIATAGNPQH